MSAVVRELRSGGKRLRWLYLLALLPTLSDILETGSLPSVPREWTTELLIGLFVLVIVNQMIRQHVKIQAETEARVRAIEQLHHADRLATVGQLAAGVAHELGSPLQVVSGRAKMIATGETSGSAAQESGHIIVEQAQRMTEIIRGLLGFARRHPAQRATTDLAPVVTGTVRILAAIAKKKAVKLESSVDGAAIVHADVVQIQQALTNVVMNAIQAVGEGGHVTVAVDIRRASPPPDHSGVRALPTGPASAAELDHVCVGVVDDGPGIDEAGLQRVFEPFFTTKDVGQGTGLGLSIAHGLVRENGGWIAVESGVGRGTRFSIFLPRHAGGAR